MSRGAAVRIHHARGLGISESRDCVTMTVLGMIRNFSCQKSQPQWVIAGAPSLAFACRIPRGSGACRVCYANPGRQREGTEEEREREEGTNNLRGDNE